MTFYMPRELMILQNPQTNNDDKACDDNQRKSKTDEYSEVTKLLLSE